MTDTPDGGDENELTGRESHLTYDIGEDEPPSHAVVSAVSSLTEKPTLELDPLYRTIPPEHLDESFRAATDSPVEPEFSFEFEGCDVTLTEHAVQVQRLDADG